MSAATIPAPVEAPSEFTLDATDRCDRCGAQAYVAAAFTHSVLLFCAHHAREHKDQIADAVILDNTHKLISGEDNRQQGADHA